MERYAKQILFTPIGETGQQSLANKKALIVGAGALGSSICDSLARAGVGHLVIVDRDFVDKSNLQRQSLYIESDVTAKLPKAIAAKDRLTQINSDITIEAHVEDATPYFLAKHITDVDVILDATDNFDTRFMLNDIAHKHGIPWIYGAVIGAYGTTFNIIPGESPCLSCLLKTVPLGIATCDTVGVIAPSVQVISAYQTAEALKILTGNQNALRKTLLTLDVWTNDFYPMDVSAVKDEHCHTCGSSPTYPHLDPANISRTAVLCGRDSVQIKPAQAHMLDLAAIETTLTQKSFKTQLTPFLLAIKLDNITMTLFPDGRALIHGTKEINEAKGIYHSVLG